MGCGESNHLIAVVSVRQLSRNNLIFEALVIIRLLGHAYLLAEEEEQSNTNERAEHDGDDSTGGQACGAGAGAGAGGFQFNALHLARNMRFPTVLSVSQRGMLSISENLGPLGRGEACVGHTERHISPHSFFNGAGVINDFGVGVVVHRARQIGAVVLVRVKANARKITVEVTVSRARIRLAFKKGQGAVKRHLSPPQKVFLHGIQLNSVRVQSRNTRSEITDFRTVLSQVDGIER